MAKNSTKTNALGMNLDPESFKAEVAREEAKEEMNQAPTVDPAKPALVESAVEGAVIMNLDDIGKTAKKAEKKNFTIYMSVSVKDELDKRSKDAGLAPGAYLDELLKRAFGM